MEYDLVKSIMSVLLCIFSMLLICFCCLWPAVLGDGGLHDGHKIHEGIVKEDIRAEDKAAGVIDQGGHINTMLLSIRSFQIGAGTGITAPYFIDVRGRHGAGLLRQAALRSACSNHESRDRQNESRNRSAGGIEHL